MLFKTSLLLLTSWLFGIAGPFDAGEFVHLLLLTGLLLLLVAFLRARDSATRRQP